MIKLVLNLTLDSITYMFKEAFTSVSEGKSRSGHIVFGEVSFNSVPKTVIQFETGTSFKRPSRKFNAIAPFDHTFSL